MPEESAFCYKLLYKIKAPSSYFVSIKTFSLELALCLIRGGWRGSYYEVVFSLNSWEQYKCACEMMTQGLHGEAYQILTKIKQKFSGSNEKVYEWLSALIEISGFENNKIGGIKAFSHIGCLDLGHNIYFQCEFFLCRYILVFALNDVLLNKINLESLYSLRNRVQSLLYLFRKPLKDTIYLLKMWRDLIGIVAVCVSNICEGKEFITKLNRFYPGSKEILNDLDGGITVQSLCKYILAIPMKYPKQFFMFLKPIDLNLQVQSDRCIKVTRYSEFILEFSAKVKDISHKPPLIRFVFVCHGKNIEDIKETREKVATAAGICNISFPIVLHHSGLFSFKAKASVLDTEGREIGKPEFAEIILECI